MSDLKKLLALPKRIGSVRWLKKYIKPFMPKIFALTLLTSTGAVLGNLAPFLYSRALGAANAGAQNIASFFKTGPVAYLSLAGTDPQESLAFFIIAYIGALLLGLMLSTVTSVVTVTITEKCSYSVRKEFFLRILNSDWLQSARLHSGDYLSRLTSDVNAVSNGILGIVPSVIALVVQLFSAFFLLVNKNALLSIVVLVLAPFAALVSRAVGKRLKAVQKKVMESEAAYRSFMQETLANLTVVKAFHYTDNSLIRLDILQKNRMKWILRRNRLSVLSSVALSFGYMSVSLFGFIYGALQIANGSISTEELILIVQLLTRVQAPIMSFASMIPQVVNILASAERLIDVEDIPSEKEGEKLPETKTLSIRASRVAYSYVEDKPVIEDSSFVVRPGEIVALAGASGMGKTTVVRMLLSLIQPKSGRMEFITDSGRAIQANPSIRNLIAYVPQGNTLLSGTIEDNLRLGKPDATIEEMWDALNTACAADFVQHLPDYLDTMVGERGVGLSEGQAQRIAIARALIRKSPLLLLDEATSSLDEKTEARILRTLKKANRNTACIIITHRMSTLSVCDRFIRIQDKKIVETTLSELRHQNNSPS